MPVRAANALGPPRPETSVADSAVMQFFTRHMTDETRRQHLLQHGREAGCDETVGSESAATTMPPMPLRRACQAYVTEPPRTPVARAIQLDQLFHRGTGGPPLEELTELLDACCMTPPKSAQVTWVLDACAFKRAQVMGHLEPFLQTCMVYYVEKYRRHYFARPALSMLYRQFVTIARQILNYHRVSYECEELNVDHRQTMRLHIRCPDTYTSSTTVRPRQTQCRVVRRQEILSGKQ